MTWQCEYILLDVRYICYIILFYILFIPSDFSLLAGGFIDTLPGSDSYGKFRVSSEEVRQTALSLANCFQSIYYPLTSFMFSAKVEPIYF